MDPYSGSYHQPPLEGHPPHRGYQAVTAQQPRGYQQGPASFSDHSHGDDGYRYYNSGTYQAHPAPVLHRYQGGGLLQTEKYGPRSPMYGHTTGYGAATSVSLFW